MWDALFQAHKAISEWGQAWNDFAARTVEEV